MGDEKKLELLPADGTVNFDAALSLQCLVTHAIALLNWLIDCHILDKNLDAIYIDWFTVVSPSPFVE